MTTSIIERRRPAPRHQRAFTRHTTPTPSIRKIPLITKKRCCANCFGDPGLSRNIIPKVIGDGTGQAHKGDCSYCGTRNTSTINPSALSQWFEMLVDCYVTNDQGKSLAGQLAEDWCLFDNPNMDEARNSELLADILNDGQIVRKSFIPIDLPVTETPQRWDDLRDEMMHRNRWFLNSPIDHDRLEGMLPWLVASKDTLEEITTLWYHARLLGDDKSFPIEKMGAPPAHLAGHGRANPAGIPYLYLGSTAKTALSEVRPHTGERACIATFQVPPIQVLDLRDPRKHVSPFMLENAEQVISLRSDLPLLVRLGLELTKPVQPRSAAFEYIPSQFFCEFIKKCRYEGVIYRSSVSDGVNLALFSPDKAEGVGVQVVQVDRVEVEISKA